MAFISKPLALGIFLVPSIFSSFVFGVNDIASNPDLSYIPRLYLQGYAGNDLLARGDLLAPLYIQADHDLFAYAQGRYSSVDHGWQDNPWTGSFGFGYRQIVSNTAILGVYALGDYTETTVNHHFWQFSPGVEALGRIFDFRANGYFPIGTRDHTTEGWADQFGNYDYIQFQGHNMYDAKFIFHEETGPGADAEVGSKLFKYDHVLVKGYVGGYYFSMQHHDDVVGGSARLTFQATRAAELSINDTYDNYAHNTFMLGLRLSVFDLFTKNRDKWVDENNLQPRLFDPIERNLGELGSGSDLRLTGAPGEAKTTPEVIPPEPPTPPTPPTDSFNDHHAGNPELSNVWFFTNDGSQLTPGTLPSGNGTYETPYVGPDFEQDNVNYIQQQTTAGGYSNAYLYFAGGTSYNTFVSGTPGRVSIFPTAVLEGRMGPEHKGFDRPATGSSRPAFTGWLQLNSNTALNNFFLHNQSPTVSKATNGSLEEAVLLDNAQGVVLDNVVIGSPQDAATAYHTGVSLINGSSLTVKSSEIYGYNTQPISPTTDGTANANGILASDSTLTAISDSIIKGRSLNAAGYGVNSTGNVAIGDISNSTFDGQGSSGFGLFAADTMTGTMLNKLASPGDVVIGNITDSTFTGTGTTVDGYGLYAKSNSGDINFGNITNSFFSGTANKDKLYQVVTTVGAGLYAQADIGSVNITSISGSAFSGIAKAIDTTSTDTNITVTGTGYGLYANAGESAIIGDISGSHFTGEGSGDAELITTSFDLPYDYYRLGKGYGYGLYETANGTLAKINSISGSTFSGTGTGYAMVNDYTDGVVNASSDSSGEGIFISNFTDNVSIGKISGSTFTGEDTSTATPIQENYHNGYGVATSTGSGLDAMGATVTIGDIENSDFSGTGNATLNGDMFGYANTFGNGLSASAYNDVNIGSIIVNDNKTHSFEGTDEGMSSDVNQAIGLAAISSQGNITIGDIKEYTFKGTSSSAFGLGFAAQVYNYYGSYEGQGGKVTIGAIDASTFQGDGGMVGVGLLAYGYGQYGTSSWGSVTIGNITNSTFDADDAIYLDADETKTNNIKVGGNFYENGKDLYDALKISNTFNPLQFVYVKGDFYPVPP